MTPADLARQNAIAIELKKDGLSQKQSGDWTLRFTVQAADMDPRLVQAAMGQRFMAALVAIDDNEMPKEVMSNNPGTFSNVSEPGRNMTQPPSDDQAEAPTVIVKERQPWRTLTPTVQCVLRCEQPAFQTFLREVKRERVESLQDAAQVVRKLCGVNSRSALTTSKFAADKWAAIDDEYQAWSRT